MPAIADAEARLAALHEHGPTPYAFTSRRPFPPERTETTPPPPRTGAAASEPPYVAGLLRSITILARPDT
ncbi:MAG: DUF3291 domain-containing protein [Pseudonocardiaceae bacterium]|nr:DUF3291 domain-containing protein [Pseudonocardiaceae bacterium]